MFNVAIEAPSTLLPPKSPLDFACRLRSNPEALSRMYRLANVFIKIAAESTAYTPLVALKGTLTLTSGAIDAFRVALPVAFFTKGKFLDPSTAKADKIINSTDLYLGIVEVTSWIHNNASGLAEFAQTLGAAYPILEPFVSVNLAKFAYPAALVLFTAVFYDHAYKFTAAYNASNAADVSLEQGVIHKKEMWKAALGMAASLGNMTVTVLAISAPVNPAVITTLVAAEALTLLVSLAGNSFSVLNPEIK